MAMKTIEMHKDRVLEQLRKHVVVYAGAGSWVRGEKSNDFDVYVVIDDTDVREAPRYVIKEQITRLLYQFEAEIAQITGVRIHIQTYLLTEFWESIKDAHPVIFTFLRDGLAIYDRGMFTIWKELLKMGKIKPSPEAIEMHMSAGNVLVDKLKGSAREVAENLYYAVLNPSQALIMLKGYEPSTPKETVNILREIFVKKEGMLSEADVELVEKLRTAYKGFEHDPNFSLKFSDIDAYVTGVEEYLKKIRELFENISTGNIKDVIDKTDEEIMSLLKSLEITGDNPAEQLREKYVNIGDLAGFIVDYLKDFKTIKEKHSSEDKLTQSESE